ncbi:MAG: TRAP transporter large permease subunit [Peptococcaceae bacterium]|nr:TRAP transporter large permease subunit [Peptococcaceae bacterium]MDH7525762.1 TRAP transporter large permease subunit [Peptococcaceae bacterium]
MLTVLAVIIAILLISILIGTPVAFALGFTTIASIVLFMNPSQVSQISRIAYEQGISINQVVVPLFILMAEFLAKGNVAADIFTVLNKYLHKIKGGLAISATLGCSIFAALCGSSPATAAAIGRVSIAQMVARGYRQEFAAGVVAAAGTLGIMIPPSIPFVMYGIITENSIAKLLIAGILPGLMLSAMLCIFIMIRVKLNPKLIEQGLAAAEQKAAAEAANPKIDDISGRTTVYQDFKLIIPPAILILLVLGSLYTGWATPTESAGIGGIGALMIVLLLRRFSKPLLTDVLTATARTSTMILFLVIFGMSLSYAVGYLGLAQDIADLIVGIGINKYVVIVLLYGLWYIMGCLMDPGSMVILTIPFIYPTLIALGFDPIWLGVVSTLCVEIGMITPPVGFNLFIIKSSCDIPMQKVIVGALPFVILLTLALAILTVFPEIATYLPSKM